MKKRVVKKESSSSSGSDAPKKGFQKKQQKRWWPGRSVYFLIAVLLLVPLVVMKAPELIQHFANKLRIRVPFCIDLSRPAELSLNHTANFYLTPEDGISLGVWQTVPESLAKEAQGKDLTWYQNSLSNGNPVFIYLHGNTGSRAAAHRVGVAKLLSEHGYHVLVPDYRGFGDSTGEPTESGLTTDALYLYNWVKARCGSSRVYVWGHSLGTGVSTNAAVKLLEQGVTFDGLILESAFCTVRQVLREHVFSWFYWKIPGHGILFPEPWANNKLVFPTEENLKKMKNPILFLHSEDDNVVPIWIVKELYEVAVSSQNAERVKMVAFEGSLGYLHNGIYRDSRLPQIIKDFVSSSL
ncbi:lysophosphatidylserine lipase ABHD12-like [Synchiropus splendidus]|uniref:lysophosphatidylserine lipase ABHD12-like n=1 Tax=Synchiropus splendidus TaxID=270530 RepID=UPI00237E9C20|nr:lysophosphatidylserine lipase ABHD12-like [Synchiropus splendidus]